MHKIRACVYFYQIKLKAFADSSVILFNFPASLLFNDFPFHDLHLNSMISLKFHDFPDLEIKTINSMTFQVLCMSRGTGTFDHR